MEWNIYDKNNFRNDHYIFRSNKIFHMNLITVIVEKDPNNNDELSEKRTTSCLFDGT